MNRIILAVFTLFTISGMAQVPTEKFLNFNCEYIDNNVQVSWTSLYDESDKVFYIERSTDSLNFEVVSDVVILDGEYKSSQNTYTYYDMNPGRDSLYYRIRSSGTGIISKTKLITK